MIMLWLLYSGNNNRTKRFTQTHNLCLYFSITTITPYINTHLQIMIYLCGIILKGFFLKTAFFQDSYSIQRQTVR